MATPEAVAATHPAIRHTRLGAVIRNLSGEESTGGLIARHLLSQPHDQPLDLMPFHVLRDWVQENPDHPLGKQFNWDKLPEKLGLDQTVQESADLFLSAHRGRGRYPHLARVIRGEAPADTNDRSRSALKRIKAKHPEATDNDIIESSRRNYQRLLREHIYTNAHHLLPDADRTPEVVANAQHTISSPEVNDHVPVEPAEQFARLRQPLEYQTEIEGVNQDRAKWNPWKGERYPSDSLLLTARNFLKAGDPRGELIQRHADLLDDTEENPGPREHASSTRDSRLLHHATVQLPDESQLRVRVHGHNEYPGVHAVSFDWTPKGEQQSFFGHYTLDEARGLADRFGKANGAVGEQIHGALDSGEEKGEPRVKFAALKAPAGGMVSQGTFFKGGQTIADPTLQLPEQPLRLSKRKRIAKRWREHKITLKYPSPGDSADPECCSN